MSDGAPETLPPQSLRRLLVGTDLSSRADRALRRAARIAAGAKAEVMLMHAIDDDQPRGLVELERHEAFVLLKDQVAGLPELRDLRVMPLVEEGDPFEAVLRVAEAHSVDLIVLGEHRRRPLRDIFIGTTVERVMRYAHTPVLMVNQPVAGQYRKVLAATDLSEHSAKALQAAASLGFLDESDLTVLHAFEPSGLGALALADAAVATMAAHESEAVRETTLALAAFVSSLGLARTPRQLVMAGRPATVIKEFAGRVRPEVLIIGAAGAGVLRRAVLGSVAAEVLAAAQCDVLVVPPPGGPC